MSRVPLARISLMIGVIFAALCAADAEQFIFATRASRLVVSSDGIAVSLTAMPGGRELLQPKNLPIASVRKGGQVYPSSAITRSGAVFHFAFGSSGIAADYRIVASAEYITVELVAAQGTGIEEIRFVQLSTPLANAGKVLGVRWDDQFALCLMSLDQQVDSKLSGQQISASAYPGFSLQNQKVAIIAAFTPHFLDAAHKVEHDFDIPSPTIGGIWAKRSKNARTSYLFTDLTESNADETIRYAKLGGFQYILIYSSTWSSSMGSYPINTRSFPNGEAGLKAVIDKCHAAGLKVGLHMLTALIGKNDALARQGSDSGLLRETQPAASNAGGKMQHPAERAGAYVADLRLRLAGVIADRISGIVNRLGFDMVYFDGGELSGVQGSPWYWVGVEQTQIWQRSRRDLLVQGSGITNWSWHIFTRGTCDDYAAVAVKEYLDYHKIADAWRFYHNNFLPAELGWVGFLQDAPDHPATSPDELEYYAVRMLALDSAGSLETTMSALRANGRTEEMLKLLGEYEQVRLSGTLSKTVREQLAQGEWHMTPRGEFHPIRYDAQRIAVPGEITSKNGFEEQTLKFRLQVAPELAKAGDRANIPLLRGEPSVEVRPPVSKDTMPGALVHRVDLSKAVPDKGTTFMVSPSDRTTGRTLDLTRHRALAVQLEVEGSVPVSRVGPVLNLQLEAGGKAYRDYYIDLNFRGFKTVILPEPGTDRTLAEFRPAYSNYPFKMAMHGFNYGNVVALNLRWMRYASGSGIRCRIGSVEALEERKTVLKGLEISTESGKIAIPGEMETGDYAEYWGEGTIRIFDRNGVLLRTAPANRAPLIRAGEDRLIVKALGAGTVKLTVITLGK